MPLPDTTTTAWELPACPLPPDWQLDWAALLVQYPWLHTLAGTPQDPHHHAEGDVLIHTQMVIAALVALPAWQALPSPTRAVLFAAALLHDIAKPRCTEVDAHGRISSPRHARVGEHMARSMLWRNAGQYGGIPFPYREQVAKLVRHHGLPLWLLEKSDPTRAVVGASQVVRLDHLALLAEADVRGRSCADQHELLGRIDLFRQYSAELGCLAGRYAFASPHSRFVYFREPTTALHYDAYDDTRFEVTLLCGLPAAGKDTWVQRQAPHLPVIALDAIRDELGAEPAEQTGQVVLLARQRARVLLQHHQPFVWNATNLTRRLRRQLIDFFAGYGARVRIVYLDAPFDILLRRNRARPNPVPEQVIVRMVERFELPDPTEAHQVEYLW